MGEPVGTSTDVMPNPVAPPSAAPRRWWLAALVGLLALGVGLAAWALADDGTVTSTAPTVVTEAEGTPTTVATATPSTSAQTTAATPSTTQPPVTTPPPATDPPPAELIPGFPATDEIDVFIDQLRDRESVAGKQSRKLGDGLRSVLKQDGDRQGDEIDRLLDKIDEWVAKEELDPAVAARAGEFLSRVGDVDGN